MSSSQDTGIRTEATNETNSGLTRHTSNQTMMEKISTTDSEGLNHLVAFSIVGPIILVIIVLVVACLILSFIKYRCDRQQRRTEASLGQGQLPLYKARMLAYSLPYNVLDFRKRFSTVDDGAARPLPGLASGPPPASGAGFPAGYGAGSPAGRTPRDPAEDRLWERVPQPSPPPASWRGELSRTAKTGLEQLGAGSLAGTGQPSVFETRYLELQPIGGSSGFGDLHGTQQHHRSPVYESKSRIKKLKKRGIRPFIMGEFQHRHRFNAAEGEGEGDGGEGTARGIMCISQSYRSDSPTTSTTSTFQMRLDRQ